MAKKAQEMRSYAVPMDFFAQKMRGIDSAGLNVSLKSENPTAEGVWFRVLHGMSWASYGEKITVTLTGTAGGTQVHILSECGMPTQIVDYGKNASNVRAIFQYLEKGLPAPGQEIPAAAPAPAAPAGAPRFCTACGSPLQPGARFCSRCGTKLG